MIKEHDYVKSIDIYGNYVEGILTKIGEDYFVMTKYNRVSDYSVNESDGSFGIDFIKINKTRCAKKLFDLPNNDSIYDFDVFATNDERHTFYVTFDYTRLAVVYHGLTDMGLPPNLNIFDCKRIGNVCIDGMFEIEGDKWEA